MKSILRNIRQELRARNQFELAAEVTLNAEPFLTVGNFRSTKGLFIRVQSKGSLAGAVQLHRESDNTLKLYNIYVRPHLRGKGIASVLMDLAKAEAIKTNSSIKLTAQASDGTSQDALVAIYESYGFVTQGSVMVWTAGDSDQDKMSPDSYRRKHSKCPDGYEYNEKKRRCIKVRDRKGDIPGPNLSDSPATPGPDSPSPAKQARSPAKPGPAKQESPGTKPINEQEDKPLNEKKKNPFNSKTPKPVNRKHNLPKPVNR